MPRESFRNSPCYENLPSLPAGIHSAFLQAPLGFVCASIWVHVTCCLIVVIWLSVCTSELLEIVFYSSSLSKLLCMQWVLHTLYGWFAIIFRVKSGQWLCDQWQGCQDCSVGGTTAFSTNGVWKNAYPHAKQMKLDPWFGGLVTQSCLTLAIPWTVAHQAPCPWDSPDKSIGVGCHFLLQVGPLPYGIYKTQNGSKT